MENPRIMTDITRQTSHHETREKARTDEPVEQQPCSPIDQTRLRVLKTRRSRARATDWQRPENGAPSRTCSEAVPGPPRLFLPHLELHVGPPSVVLGLPLHPTLEDRARLPRIPQHFLRRHGMENRTSRHVGNHDRLHVCQTWAYTLWPLPGASTGLPLEVRAASNPMDIDRSREDRGQSDSIAVH